MQPTTWPGLEGSQPTYAGHAHVRHDGRISPLAREPRAPHGQGVW